MRKSFAKIPYRASTTSSISAAFSTASGGRGRGRAAAPSFQFTPDNNNSDNERVPPPPQGHGRGRAKPLPSSSILPSFSSFVTNDSNPPPSGRGRGFTPPNFTSPPPPPPPPPQAESEHPSQRPPKSNVKDDEAQYDSDESEVPAVQDKALPGSVINVLSGAGRGKPISPPAPKSEKPKAENRHIRQGQRPQSPVSDVAAGDKSSTREQLSNEEKVKKAVGILSRGEQGGERGGSSASGARGRGSGSGRGRGRGRGRESGGRDYSRYDEAYDEEPTGMYLGDPADEEKVAQRLGPEVMSKLAEGFEEMSGRVLPSPYDDALLDAYDINLRIECEPEYLMEQFGTNPDIDEKPPIPLRDALEKMKPFLMKYEGIQNQQEWEETMEDTMKRVPLIKEIVDYYSGPDRVTAKQQQEELQRVVETLPASAPTSVKRFTDRAFLSLQSNPGWGFDKKCEFMSKLVGEVSKQYK